VKDQSKDYKIKAQIIKNDKVEEVELRVVASGEIVFFYKKNILVEIRSKEELKFMCKVDIACNSKETIVSKESNIHILVNTVELYSIIQ